MPDSGVLSEPDAEHSEDPTITEQTSGGWRSWVSTCTQRPAVRAVLLALTFITFTIAMLWPLPLHAGSAVQDLGDPLYEIWTMRWVQHQLATDPTHLWDGNMGYPFSDSLLFSEPRISTSVIAWPIQVLSGNDILSYNLMLMASYVLVGLGMALIVTEITGETGPAVLTGFISAFVPYRYGHLSHLNLLSYGWGLLALWLLLRFAQRRHLRDALWGAVCLIIQVLASDTLGVMALFVIVCAILVVVWQERSRLTTKLGIGLLLILIIPAIAELPVALARLRVDRRYDFTRSLDTVAGMSASFHTYWSVSPGNRFWESLGLFPTSYPGPLFPGVIATLAAVIGLVFAARRWPHWTAFAGIIALVGFVFSLGPYTSIGGRRFRLPYYFFFVHVPGFDAMRDASRFGMLALIGVEILAGLGLAALWRLLRPRLPEQWRTISGVALLALLLVVAISRAQDQRRHGKGTQRRTNHRGLRLAGDTTVWTGHRISLEWALGQSRLDHSADLLFDAPLGSYRGGLHQLHSTTRCRLAGGHQRWYRHAFNGEFQQRGPAAGSRYPLRGDPPLGGL